MSNFSIRFTITCLAACALVPGVAQANATSSMTGILTEKHGDRLDGTRTPSTFEVVSPSGTVDLAGRQPRNLVGRMVTVTDDDERRAGVQGVPELADRAARAKAEVPSHGSRPTLVVLVGLSDLSQAITAEQARAAIFTGSDSVSAFFGQQSGGVSRLVGIQRGDGDVVGPVGLAVAGRGCDEDAIADAADAAATANGFSPARYQQIVYVLPRIPDCTWAGLGQLPGRRTWTNGYLDTGVIAHEVGHNRGNHHAASLRCADASGQPTTLSGSCHTSEYGDPFDVMGLQARLMSSFHRVQNGDLPDDARRVATASATYPLSSANAGSGARLLLVPRKSPGQPVSEWYALERRSPLAPFDTFAIADPVSTGVTVRLVRAVSGTDQTRLLDMSPDTETVLDAPLQPNRSFDDPQLPIQLRVTADNEGVEVTMPVLVDDVAPQFLGTPRVVTSAGRAVLSWPEAIDDERLARYEIERGGTIVGSTTALTYTDAVAGPVVIGYRVIAVDAAGNRSAIGPVTATIPGPTKRANGTAAGGGSRSGGAQLGRIRLIGRSMRATRGGWIVVQRFAATNATRMSAAVGGRRVTRSASSRLTVRFRFPHRATRRTVTVRASNGRASRSSTSTWRR